GARNAADAAQARADSAYGRAGDALSAAAKAQSRADSAYSRAGTGISNAATAQSRADSAYSGAGTAKSRAESAYNGGAAGTARAAGRGHLSPPRVPRTPSGLAQSRVRIRHTTSRRAAPRNPKSHG